jgi:hypothetical protein
MITSQFITRTSFNRVIKGTKDDNIYLNAFHLLGREV